MPTINLYVSDELKKEMDLQKDTNWSAIAQDAFRHQITSARATAVDIETVVKRIKGTAGERSPKFIEGKTDGAQWAAEVADADDMDALMEMIENEQFMEEISEASAVDAAATIANHLGVEHDYLWGDTHPTKRHIEGFLRGAAGVFAQVAKRLRV